MQRIAQLLALVILTSLVSAGVVDKAGARKANNEGIDLATKGKLDKSLSAFSKAIELDPTNGEYVNNLGVSQMRLGQLDAAENNFRKALKLEPHNPDARTNLADLLKYLESSGKKPAKREAAKPIQDDEDDDEDEDEDDEEEEDEEEEEVVVSHKSKSKSAGTSKKDTPKPTPAPKVRKPHPRKPLPAIHIKDLYKPENTKYAMGDRPFKLVGAMDKWPALTKWTDSFISSTFPDSIVDFYPHNMDKSDTHPYLTKMSQALSELWKPSGAFPDNKIHPGTYLQWNIHVPEWQKLREDMDLPWKFMHDEVWLEECLSTDALRDEYNKKTHWRMMLIGNKGAGMFGHVDVLRTSSWQAQFRGAKKWFLCDPAQKKYLYHAGDVDAWDWDPEKHPLFEHADCYEDIVRAGEMFYYPRDYWHQTLNLETPSMSISGTICDHHNFDTIAAELKNECDFQKFKWGFSKELCAELPKCWKLWKDRWRPESLEKCDAAGKR